MTVIGCGLQAAQQLCGFNTLMYYSASIFAALGFKNATAVGCMIAMVNFAFTLVALRVSFQIHTGVKLTEGHRSAWPPTHNALHLTMDGARPASLLALLLQ